jgi:hypothetical protein
MPASIVELVEQLADAKSRISARDKLVELGAQATPALLSAAKSPRDIQHYKAVLRTLLLIKDSRTENLFRQILRSDDQEIRAIGARGLHLLKAPDALKALQSTINDSPDPLHFEQTPAVQSLLDLGAAALPTVLVLMDSVNERTRQRAQYVLTSVVLRDISQRLQPRPLTSDALTAWEELRQANGSYQWDGPESLRKASIDLWKLWLARFAPQG